MCVTAQSFGGDHSAVPSESSPQSALGHEGIFAFSWVSRVSKKAAILPLISSFIYIFCSFPQGTRHMNQPLSMSWHLLCIKRCFCRSVLQNNAVLLHLKNICVFCEIGLLFIRQHMCFHVILLEWVLGGLPWREESKMGVTSG